MPSNNSKYSDEIRERTAKHIIESCKSATSVAEEMGIDTNTVCRWVRDYRRKHHLPSYAENKGIKHVATKIDKEMNKQIKARDKRITELEEEVEILKKIPAHLYATTVMKYEFIYAYRSEFTVIRMCKALKVHESGFYRWRDKGKRTRDIEDEILVTKIRAIHEESKLTYGPSRIKAALEKQGILNAGISRIRRLMRENGIYSVTRYKHRPYPKEKVETRYNDNIIDREFMVKEPDIAWCGDITYIKTSSGWVYLAAVIDLFNREVVGYSLSKKANTELAKRAMANALVNRKPSKRLIFHSDRGCQYSSNGYLEYLEEHNVESSMSRKGNPYDNACTESFFATLKKEWIYRKLYKDLEDLDSSLFEYIDLFYNRKRMHSSLANQAPREYYLQYKAKKAL